MAGKVHRVAEEPRIVEASNMRFEVSGDYVAFGVDGAPLYKTEGLARERRIVAEIGTGDPLKSLGEDEWSPSIRMLPTWVDFAFHGRSEPDLYCRIELRQETPRVTEFGWRANEFQEDIRQKHLRATAVDRIAQTVYGMWIIELRDVTRSSEGEAVPMKLGTEQERVIRNLMHDMRAGRRHVDSELLKQVADVYRANIEHAPAEAVANTFHVKPRMAHEYVKRARDRGFLPPTTQGKKRA